MMKKILQGIFVVFYAGLLSAGIWVSRTFAVPVPSQAASAAEAWKISADDLLTAHDNQPLKDSFVFEQREILPAFKIQAQEDDRGQLLEFFNPEGFCFRVDKSGPYGPFAAVLAVDSEGRLTGVRQLLVSEPRGVGRAFEDASFFWESFKGKTRDELFLISEGGKISPVLGAVEASKRYTRILREEVESFQRAKSFWIEEAMKGRRSFEDLNELQERQTAPLNEEDQDENFFPQLF